MRRVMAIALLVYLAGLARVTLGPSSTPSKAVERTAEQVERATRPGDDRPRPTAQQQSVVDLALNVLLFVPFGFLVRGLSPRWRCWAVVAAGTGLSCAIELSQRWVFTWRGAQLSDVVTNGLGAALGCGLAAAVFRRRAVSPRAGP